MIEQEMQSYHTELTDVKRPGADSILFLKRWLVTDTCETKRMLTFKVEVYHHMELKKLHNHSNKPMRVPDLK